ncbi:hypothetical protein GQ457_18G002570 [Hibiscus cannabinus]
MVVQLGGTTRAIVDPRGTGLQPHAVPSSLEAKRPKPSLKTHGPTPGLEWAGQNQDPMHPTRLAEPESNLLNAPTWVTSRSYSTRRAISLWAMYLNNRNQATGLPWVKNCFSVMVEIKLCVPGKWRQRNVGKMVFVF